VASIIYNNAKLLFADQSLDFVNGAINVILVDNYVPDVVNDVYLSDISNYEISGTGYTSAGQTLTTKRWIVDNVNDRVILSADSPDWSNSTLSATGAILYRQVITSASQTSTNYQIGTPGTINWNFQDVLSDVAISLSIDGGNNYSFITNDTPNTGSYTWTPTSANFCTSAIIQVQGLLYTDPIDGVIIDFSDITATSNFFSITNDPYTLGHLSYTYVDYTRSTLISFIDFSGMYVTTGNDFAINWSPYDGILYI